MPFSLIYLEIILLSKNIYFKGLFVLSFALHNNTQTFYSTYYFLFLIPIPDPLFIAMDFLI